MLSYLISWILDNVYACMTYIYACTYICAYACHCIDSFLLLQKEWGLDLEDFGTENGAADDMVPCSHFKHHTMGAEVPNVACLHRAHTVEQETALPNSNDGTPPASKPLLHTNGSVKRVRFREQLEDVFEERDDVGSNRSKRKTRTDMVSPKSVLKSPSQLQGVTPVGHANGDDTVKEHVDGRGGYPNSNDGEDGNQKNGGDDDEHDNGSDDAIQILMDDAMELLIKSSHVRACSSIVTCTVVFYYDNTCVHVPGIYIEIDCVVMCLITHVYIFTMVHAIPICHLLEICCTYLGITFVSCYYCLTFMDLYSLA